MTSPRPRRANGVRQCQPALTGSTTRDRKTAGYDPGADLATTAGMSAVRTTPRPSARSTPSLPAVAAAALGLALGAWALPGCNREERRQRNDHFSTAPNLGGRVVGADGVARTQVDVRDVLQAGEAVAGALPARGVLAGYEFEAFRGGEITAELEVFDRGGPVGLAFYGPRSTTGLWDSALEEVAGPTPGLLSVSTDALSTAGTYLVLVWADEDAGDARFELRLSCKGNCGEPKCPELEPCDLVCDFGFLLDAEACRICTCQDAPQCGEGVGQCAAGQICGEDGRCAVAPPPPPECTEDAPVCDSLGTTWPNRCALDAADRTFAHAGACVEPPPAECSVDRPCTPPQICTAGRCEAPTCDCPVENAPVCSTSGETYRNLCELSCREGEAAFDHPGPCGGLTPCRGDDDCRRGQICEPVRDPANMRRCNADPDAADCQRVCVMAQAGTTCGPGLPACRADQVCYALEGGAGPCVQRCDLATRTGCDSPETACAAVTIEGLAEGEGACMPLCAAEAGHRGCPPGMACVPEADGPAVCQSCDCPPPQPGEEVCTDQQQQFPSACMAACAHAATWRAGRCDGAAACECPSIYAPVCGPDGRLYNRCEAGCELPQGTALTPILACLPPGTPLPLDCVRDEDCVVGGCGGALCAAGPVREAVCPPLSDELQCYAEAGDCRCVHNRCGFTANRDVARCVDGLPGGASTPDFPADAPPPPPDAGP